MPRQNEKQGQNREMEIRSIRLMIEPLTLSLELWWIYSLPGSKFKSTVKCVSQALSQNNLQIAVYPKPLAPSKVLLGGLLGVFYLGFVIIIWAGFFVSFIYTQILKNLRKITPWKYFKLSNTGRSGRAEICRFHPSPSAFWVHLKTKPVCYCLQNQL